MSLCTPVKLAVNGQMEIGCKIIGKDPAPTWLQLFVNISDRFSKFQLFNFLSSHDKYPDYADSQLS